MGTQTLGTTSNPGTTHFVFFSSASGVCFKAEGNPQTTPEEMYIDRINVWASTHSGTRTMKHAIYGTGGTKLGEGDITHSFNTTAQFTHSEFDPNGVGYLHLLSGQHIVAAVFCTTDLEAYGNGSGSGRDMKEHNGTFPSSWSTSNDVSGEGDLIWNITYFPVAQITSIPTSPVTPGASFDIEGRSWTAGVVSVSVNGVNCPTFSVTDDDTLNITLPTSGVSSGPIVVVTKAGTATSADDLQVGSVYVDDGSTQEVIIAMADTGSAWVDGVQVWADMVTSWVQIG